jgi:hypothetical protein
MVVLSAETESLWVPATTIDTLWTRGSAVKTGAIVGALTGLALGVVAGATCNEWGEGDCPTDTAVLALGGIGLGGGALLGSLLGLAIPKWHRQYP